MDLIPEKATTLAADIEGVLNALGCVADAILEEEEHPVAASVLALFRRASNPLYEAQLRLQAHAEGIPADLPLKEMLAAVQTARRDLEAP